MLSIIATLKECWSMLPGANKHVFINHKIFSFDDLKTQWVFALAQQNQSFLPWLYYVKCPRNILVDNLLLSWLHCLPSCRRSKAPLFLMMKMKSKLSLLTAKTPESVMMTSMPCFNATSICRDPRSDTKPLIAYANSHSKTTTSGSTSKAPKQYMYKSLNDNLDNTISFAMYIKETTLMNNGTLPCRSKCWSKL